MSNTLAAYKGRNNITSVQNQNYGLDDFSDFYSDDTTQWTQTTATSGSVGQLEPTGIGAYFVGSKSLTVALTNAVAGISKASNLVLSNASATQIESRNIGTVSIDNFTNTNYKHKLAFGFADNATDVSTILSNSFVGLYYDPAISSNWICLVKNGTSTLAQSITSTAVVSADTYLRVVVNPDSTQFLINNDLVYNASYGSSSLTNLNSNGAKPVFFIQKVSGSSTVRVYIDAIHISQKLLTNRTFTAL